MTCRHHWLIELPNGPTSRGECLKCHEQREFLNSRDEYGPERRASMHKMYSTSDKQRWRGVYRK